VRVIHGLDVRQGIRNEAGKDGRMRLDPPQLSEEIDQILVVAPTDALRASLRFLLEEESYRVTTASSIEEAAALPRGFACAVLDHHALRAKSAAAIEDFIHGNWPVVLLANGTPGVELPASFRVVTKPLLGAALSHAVREAVAIHH
jgi:CheY-like chemotaxis protein